MVPFLLLFLSFYCWTVIKWYEVFLWSFWVSPSDYILYQDLAHPLPPGWVRECWRQPLCCACPAHRSRNNGVLSTPSSHQYKVQHYEGCYGENLLDPTDSATVMTSCRMWGSGMLCLRSYSISPGTTRETQWCWGWLHLCIHRKHWATAQLNLCLLILVIKCPLTPQIYICSYYQWTIHMQLHVSNDIWGLFYYTLKRKK